MKRLLVVSVALLAFAGVSFAQHVPKHPTAVQAQPGNHDNPADPSKAPQADGQKLTELESLKMELAQKDLLISQLQSQIVQLSSRLLNDSSVAAQTKMVAQREEITKAHPGMQVVFDPTGLPFLAPLPAPPAPPAKK